MPRTHSAKKPGCFNQVKPTLMFTDSPPERLPKRLCSPINAADNPITAHVLYAEDGLETTWVSPQFHPSMLEMGEAPKRGRRRKKDTENIGKSAMVSQNTTRSRRPVRKSSVLSSTTPNHGERRFPKGFKPLLFLGDSSRKDKDQKMGTGDEEADVDDTDCDVDSAMSGVEHWRRCASAKNMRQSFNDEEQIEMGENENTSYHGRVDKQSMVGMGRGASITRSRISSVSHLDERRRHPYQDDDEDDADRCGKEGVLHNTRVTALKDKPASTSSSRRHHTSNHAEDVFVAPDENFACNLNYSNLNNLPGWSLEASQDYGQSPRFDRINMKYQDEVRNKIDNGARDRSGEVCLQKQPIKDLSKGGCDGTDKKGKVLAADTPVSDYGVRVSLRRRRNLLPKQYRDRLLLDSK